MDDDLPVADRHPRTSGIEAIGLHVVGNELPEESRTLQLRKAVE